jgi:prevent-host-death family protein
MSTVDISKDILSLTEFKRKTSECVEQMRESGRPMVFTVNGKAQLVVQDAESYQKLLDAIERAASVEGIRRGLEDIKHGRTKSLKQFEADFRKKYKMPRAG